MEIIKLPIGDYEAVIKTAVFENQVVIITAETGAGKSTQVPLYLLDEGYSMVVTEPRRLAARTLAARVAEEDNSDLGDIIGYRTAHEGNDSPNTKCLFVTDGLALVRELMLLGRHDILVLDEVHEWNTNLEVLVAWVRRSIAAGAKWKVVLMSATVEAEKLSKFFDGAPVITVPGRQFPVEERLPSAKDIAGEAIELLRQGRNVLVFQPGKKEIVETTEAIKASGVSAEVLSLHGDLEPGEQARAFAHYARPKCVIATNVAQTSITIDDIDAVVDSGMERRTEVVDGVEGLYLKPISLADSKQRKGRAGRCRPGIYIDCYAGLSVREEYPKPEILRTLLDQTVLRLASIGFDMEDLSFFHQPNLLEIQNAKRSLRVLGCMDEKGEVTSVGHEVSKLPLSVPFARMIVEANRLGVVNDVLTIAAILDQGELTIRQRDRFVEPAWKKLVPSEYSSDVMVQLIVWEVAMSIEGDREKMQKLGIFPKAFYQAKDKRRHLRDVLQGKVHSFRSTGDREKILKAVCSGMIGHLYRFTSMGWMNGDGQVRELARESVVRGAEWVVGLPFDLEVPTRRGGKTTLKLIRMATKVDPSWLIKIAPQLVRLEHGSSPVYDSQTDVCTSLCQTYFNSQKVGEVREATPDHPDAARVFAEWIAGQIS